MMKKLCSLLGLVAVGFTPVQAQVFQPNQVRGGILGAVAGALIGGHNNDRWAEGAAIGAVAGTLIGTMADRNAYAAPAPTYAYAGTQTQVIGDAPYVTSAPVVTQTVIYVQPAPVRVVRRPQVVYVAPAPVLVIGGRGHYASPGYSRTHVRGRRW
ncbi:glycine zipper 2TM domain-containing protein [Horticoccus luteus]|uniref:Glycine zipper 2TM domain-containing protein n=1 Tax=Horticoccus luteus TaxID=2862869 RepID=A0A8F9TYA8_9BACT|nr:YMGG-like glycine zipper-containing protein [Horticoccus luteus]QYM80458.1 glycine zipper 2TM domain-containing protein [Horticoccus luteus]